MSVPPDLPTAIELEVRNNLNRQFEEAYDANGVDRSLIRCSPSRTPKERVRAIEETLTALATLTRLDREG